MINNDVGISIASVFLSLCFAFCQRKPLAAGGPLLFAGTAGQGIDTNMFLVAGATRSEALFSKRQINHILQVILWAKIIVLGFINGWCRKNGKGSVNSKSFLNISYRWLTDKFFLTNFFCAAKVTSCQQVLALGRLFLEHLQLSYSN